MTTKSESVTQLLVAWSDGDQAALDQLVPLVHEELRRLARNYMRGERGGHTLQTTALVNEAYLRLVDQKHVRWQNRAHFLAIAAQLMRRILVDHARRRQYQKRGAGAMQVSLAEAQLLTDERTPDLVALDEALVELTEIDPRRSRVVELRFFGGLNIEETAEILKVSPTTPDRFNPLMRWTPDGSAIAYIHNRGGAGNIWALPVRGGAARQLTEFESDSIFWFDWSRDGKQLAVSRGTQISDVVLISNLN